MEIMIKPAAEAQLKKYQFQDNEGVRIEAVYVGSCSLYAEHNLTIDQKRENDDLFVFEGIPLLVSKESKKLLHDKITLDYNPSLGYKLSSAEEIYRYNLQLVKK